MGKTKGLTTQNISFAFATIIFLLAAIGGISVVEIYYLKKDMDNLYRHPFAVSNAAKEINIHLNAMHRSMKDVVLSKNENELTTAIARVDKEEAEAFSDFDTIFDRFLGNKSQIQNLHKNFIRWKSIRDRVIALVREGKTEEAAMITKGEGADHVALLERQTRELVSFAFGKAQEFHSQAVQKEKLALMAVSFLLVLSIFVAVFISFWVIRDLKTSRKEAARRTNLIDQNVLIAWLDKEGNIKDLSNHLARLVGAHKERLIGVEPHAILGTDNHIGNLENILRVAQSGKVWRGEIRRLDAKGEVHWLLAEVHPELDEHFKVIGFTVIYQDVSDKKISVTDQLTSLPNRRSFDATIEHEIRLAKRDDKTLTLAILDVDFFKKYNDFYGHPKGDLVLSKVAQAIKDTMRRPGDYVARIGGEEFAILFSGANVSQARKTLELVCTVVEELKIPHEKSSVSDFVTVSIGGMVSSGGKIIDVEEFYECADRVLYMAKKKRNTVMVEAGNITAISSASF